MTPAEGERLHDAVGVEWSFRDIGVDKKAFLDALPQQALNAYEDRCAPANPRMPMLEDMRALMRAAYHGHSSESAPVSGERRQRWVRIADMPVPTPASGGGHRSRS